MQQGTLIRGRARSARTIVSAVLALAALAPSAWAQDANILLPVAEIEQRLRFEPLNPLAVRGSRAVDDRTQQVSLAYPDSSIMLVKWAKAAPNGETFNNVPRYEAAAYEIQKLFLEESEYVVPPTVIRAVPTAWFKQHDPYAERTFDRYDSVVLVLQYWVLMVTGDDFFDEKRFEADSIYARHLANMNLLTHLIRHNDANVGNFLVSTVPQNPRLFSVDNGVAFRSEISNRGYEWRDIRVKKLPRATIERLRQLTPERLQEALGVIAHFDVQEGQLVLGTATENLNPGRGIRRTDTAVQFGLTEAEIRDVANRIRRLLERVDDGRYELF